MYCSSVCIGKNVAQLVKYWSGVQRVEIKKERSECTATSKKASFKCIHVKNVGHPPKSKECTQDHSSQHNVPSVTSTSEHTRNDAPPNASHVSIKPLQILTRVQAFPFRGL